MKTVNNIKDLYKKGHIILNGEILERFKNHLAETTIFEAIGIPRNL
jgi:hypothetical protein